eukprot:6192708-Pleurochrysis_carterae.AAC.5
MLSDRNVGALFSTLLLTLCFGIADALPRRCAGCHDPLLLGNAPFAKILSEAPMMHASTLPFCHLLLFAPYRCALFCVAVCLLYMAISIIS